MTTNNPLVEPMMPSKNTDLHIDLNADVGEGCGQDDKLMPIISSANICCGLHAGSPSEMVKTIELAKAHGVRVGAHPSFDDRENFGRTNQTLSQAELVSVLTYQLGAIKTMCQHMGVTLSYVKPHGALYNQAAKDPVLAQWVAQAIYAIDPKLSIMALSGGELIKAAHALGMNTESEVFADRRYEDNGALVARSQPNATIDNDDEAIAQVLQMIQHGTVTSVNGKIVPVQADSVCLHGDGAHAVEFAKRIQQTLQQQNIAITANGSA